MEMTVLSCLLLLLLSSCSGEISVHGDFVHCLSLQSHNSTSIRKLIYIPADPSYSSVLNFSIQNLRFLSPETSKPQVIFTPVEESQIPAVIYCAKKQDLLIRVRSGGHDFEGQSYTADVPFLIIDLINLRSVTVDVKRATAWVQAGATKGELYYSVANKSRVLGFPAAYSPTVGLGGFVSGGGYGLLLRKYGLAADNVLDARFINGNGEILDRRTMGEDLFWAIRGGGAANFGVVLAWKLKLVAVPDKVTVFTIPKTIEQNGTEIIHKWQYIAPKFPKDLFLRIRFKSINSSDSAAGRTVQASFQALFLGQADQLLRLIQTSFPELGLLKEDCIEMSWIESMLYFISNSQTGTPLDVLLNRTNPAKRFLKVKSDFVREPIPIKGIEGIWKLFNSIEAGAADMVWTPFGGKMEEISDSEIPYPHRSGVLFKVFEAVNWFEGGTAISNKHISWIRKLYKYLGRFVSRHPREAYLNYRDLDLGVTKKNTSYWQARKWGVMYFKNNFERLAQVKNRVDPDNFFRNEQSIPPFLNGLMK